MSYQVTPDHIAGLVVGEGCFYVESGADSKYRSGWRIRPAFCIEMRHDDKEVLEAVQLALGCGSIYDLDFGRYRGHESKEWHPHVKYRVSNLADLHGKVVPFFQEHPLFGRKRTSFELFAELVEMKTQGEHLDDEGLARAKALAKQLTGHNKKGTG
jgi:hypothetical protein